jgi:hypothetical protein
MFALYRNAAAKVCLSRLASKTPINIDFAYGALRPNACDAHARDMKHEHEQCSEQIVVRVPPTLRDRLEAAAAAEGRSLANMARRLLESAVPQSEDQAA